jgi:hypothetical protein
MADNWIDNLSDRVHKQDAHDLKDAQIRLHESKVISEKSRGLWDDLVLVVQRDIRRFEKDFPHESERVMEINQISQNCFRLSKAGDSGFSLSGNRERLQRDTKNVD